MNRWFDHAWLGSAATAGLRQRKWDRADGHKQKQVERASNEMRFDGGVNLLFHVGVVLVRIVIFPDAKSCFGNGTPFLLRNAEKRQALFSVFYEKSEPRMTRIQRQQEVK